MADPVQIQPARLQPLTAPPSPGKALHAERLSGERRNDTQLKKACAEFESLFIYQLFQEMRKTVSKSGFISEGQSGPMVNSMLDMQLSKELASQKGIGLAQVLYDQLKNYEKSAKP